MMRRSIILLALLISSLLISCGHKDDPVAPPVDTGGTTADDTTLATHGDTTFNAEVRVTVHRFHTVAGISGDTSVRGEFYLLPSADAKKVYLCPKEVTYNGVKLDSISSPHRMMSLDPKPGRPVPVSFDGAMQRFRIAGSAAFPWIEDSVRAPAGVVEFLEPRVTDTISRSKGIVIRLRRTGVDTVIANWNCGGIMSVMSVLPRGVDTLAIHPDMLPAGPGPFTIVFTDGTSIFRSRWDGTTYIFMVTFYESAEIPMMP